MITTTTHERSATDQTLAMLGVLAPVTALLFVLGYARDRARHAWRDERGLSSTVEHAIWAGLGLVAAIGIGALIVAALRNRATDVSNDIENTPLP